MEALIVAVVFLVFGYRFVSLGGFPKLSRAYPAPETATLKTIGTFYLSLHWLDGVGTPVNVAGNRDGMLIKPKWAFWLDPAFIPWGDVWFSDMKDPLRQRQKVGFWDART